MSDEYNLEYLKEITQILKGLTPNRLKLLLLLPNYKEDAMRFKFIKKESKIEQKNLRMTLKELLRHRLITYDRDAYKSGYKFENGKEVPNMVESSKHYFLTSLGRLFRFFLGIQHYYTIEYLAYDRDTSKSIYPKPIRDYLNDLCLTEYNRINLKIFDIKNKLDEELIEQR